MTLDELFSDPRFTDFPVSLHLAMLRDKARMEAYAGAIGSVVFPGCTVLDVGAGTGVLSMLAARCGAATVYAIENTPVIEAARRAAKLNCPDSNIIFIKADLLEDPLPPIKADVAICELFGNFGVDEGVVSILERVKAELLVAEGVIIPRNLELVCAPVQCTRAYREIAHWMSPIHGLDFSPVQDLAYNSVYLLTGEPVRLLADEQVLSSTDFNSGDYSREHREVSFEFPKQGVIHGVAGWFRSDLAAGYRIDTGPDQPASHWGQVLLPIGDPVRVRRGGTLKLKFEEQDSPEASRWTWAGEIHPAPESSSARTFRYCANRRFTSSGRTVRPGNDDGQLRG